MKRKCYSSLFISFVWQRYEKRHEKALGKAWKSGAEGESLKLLKESGAIVIVFSLKGNGFCFSLTTGGCY